GGRAGIESPGKTDLYQVVCGRRGISTLVPLLPASHRRKLLDYVSLRTTITGRVTSTTGDQTTMTFRTFLLSACLLFFGSATVSAETLKIGLNYPETGRYKNQGLQQRLAAYLAVEEINQACGVLQ